VDWSTVLPAVITGAVGIVGVTGTLLSARISARSTSERDQLAEKRRVYAQYFRVVWELTSALFALNSAADPEASDGQWRKAVESVENIYDTLRQAAVELILIAPFAVVVIAGEIERHYQQCWLTCRRAADSPQRVGEDPKALLERMRELEEKLRNAMRKDLGGEVL
jgi:hypothetical protein